MGRRFLVPFCAAYADRTPAARAVWWFKRRALITTSMLTLTLIFDMASGSIPARAAPVQNNESNGVEAIVVTARRRAESLQSEPLSITALTAEKLDKMNVRSLYDITGVPNVNITKQPGFLNTVQISIRGIGESDPILTNDQPIAMYVDGVLIARSVASQIDLIEPERIEILRGPQGSLFGRNTTGGAVSITLPAPADDFTAKVMAGYATNNELTLRAVVDTGEIGDTGLKAKIAVQHHDMNGYVRNIDSNNEKYWPGADTTDDAYFALRGNLGQIGTFDYRFDYSHSIQFLGANQLSYVDPAVASYFGQSPQYGGNPFIYSSQRLDALGFYPLDHSKGHVLGNALTLNFPISDAFNIKSITALRSFTVNASPSGVGGGLLYGIATSDFVNFNVQRVTPNSLEPAYGDPNADFQHQRQVSQEFQFSGTIGRHKYVAGLFYFNETYFENFHGFSTLTSDTLPFLPPDVGFQVPYITNYSGQSESYAAYVSDSYTPPIFDDKLELTGGFRFTVDKRTLAYLPDPVGGQLYDRKYKRFSAPSGDATIKYQWIPTFMTYLRYANAYKSGGFSGRDTEDAPGYKPEYANNFEGGFKADMFDRSLRVNADVFYTKYTDKQVTTFSSGLTTNGANASFVTNAGSVQYLGSELEITYQPVREWEIDSSWGHTWPKYLVFNYQPLTNGPIYNIAGAARFPYFSKTSASLGSQYTFEPTSIGQISARADFSFKSGQYFHPSDTFNTRNEEIKGGSQKLLNASINLDDIPVALGRSNVTVSVYCQNCTNSVFRINGVDYGVLGFATNWYNRPRVVGVNVTATY